jgi:type IX secretion system substrate protein
MKTFISLLDTPDRKKSFYHSLLNQFTMKKLILLIITVLSFNLLSAQDFCPGNLFTNGDLEIGTPTPSDQDINNALGFSSIWAAGSLADFYAFNAGPFPPPIPATGNYAGLWISNNPSASTTYREGLFNALNSTISNSSGIYSFTFDIACLYGWGAAEVGVYGIYNPTAAYSATPTSSHTPSNENLFGPANTVLLGTVPVGGGCGQTKTTQTITFDSGAAGFPFGGMTHVLITPSSDTISGGIYVGIDNFCMQLEAPAEDTCAAVIDANIECGPNGYTYTFTIQNNTGQVVDGIIVNGQYDPTAVIPAGGTYGPITINIPVTSTNTYCFDIILFDENLACCHYEHCVDLPNCNPCDSVSVVANSIVQDPTNNGDGCCYEIDVINNFDDQYFSKITSTILTPGVNFDNPYGDNGWTVNPTSGNVLTWTPSLPYIDQIADAGVLNFCLKDVTQVSQMPQTIQFDWIITNAAGQDSIVCSEILTFDCEPCLNIANDTIYCLPNGDYQYCMTITNNDPTYTATQVFFDVYSPVANQFTPNNINVSIPPLGSASVCVTIPGPLPAGTNVLYKTILKNFSGDILNWCCVVDTFSVTIPECGNGLDCAQIVDYYMECLDDLDGDGQPEYNLHIDATGYGTILLNTPCGTISPSSITVAGSASVNLTVYSNGTCSVFNFTAYATDAVGVICWEQQFEIDFPPCPQTSCLCQDLPMDVMSGFTTAFNCPKGIFTPNALKPCDEVQWSMNGVLMGSSLGNDPFEVTYPGPGSYTICMIVFRIDDNGDICEREICKDVVINQWCIELPDPSKDIALFPNPAVDNLTIDLGPHFPNGIITIDVLDINGRMIVQKQTTGERKLRLDISSFKSGMYFLNVAGAGDFKANKRFIKVSNK